MSQADQAVEAIGRIFNARSVTIIGASSDPNKFGYMTLDTMMRAGLPVLG
jgi:acyl-CoA synthetase (NDP forming)